MSESITDKSLSQYEGMTVGEWADAMIAQLQKLPVIQSVVFMNRMPQEQRDIIQARLQQGEAS